MKSLSIILPVKDEEQHIIANLKVVESVLVDWDYEIIAIDDGSSDDTSLILKQKAPMIKTYYKPISRGKGAAIKTGYKLVKPNSDYVAFLDADLEINPDDIFTFFKIMQFYDADAVVGNKHHPYSNVHYPFIRKIISNCYHLMIKFLFGLSLRDTQCGFKLFKKEILDKIMPKIVAKEFAFDLELLVVLKENNIRVVDAPVYVQKKSTGCASLRNMIKTGVDTLAVFYRMRKGWYKI